MTQRKFAVNHIVECDQQTGVILQQCENNSYLVDFVNGGKKCIPITEIASIPLSEKLLSIIGFSFEDSLIECSCLAPLDKMPMIEKGCCKIEVGGNVLHFQVGDAEQNLHSIQTLNDLQDYFVSKKIPFDFSNRQLLVRIATMGMLTYDRKNLVGALTF